MTDTSRAQAAYAAYGHTTGGLTHDGRPMPTWDQLGDTIQAAWIAAATAAANYVPPRVPGLCAPCRRRECDECMAVDHPDMPDLYTCHYQTNHTTCRR
ncbi:hypothetical protein F4556_002381 [Kitasatospora gansuensis]|uniref:Uncharacterized protein n=1 Tax=Kitasatospora gansuensis TaxID=258050 RepID=A0A7W7WH47_9ACTN|nr:hypothetical protein [Kitasatospora gansuensis]MBB4946846.1 hypothetical protein [Kitasatospora gansuensis]